MWTDDHIDITSVALSSGCDEKEMHALQLDLRRARDWIQTKLVPAREQYGLVTRADVDTILTTDMQMLTATWRPWFMWGLMAQKDLEDILSTKPIYLMERICEGNQWIRSLSTLGLSRYHAARENHDLQIQEEINVFPIRHVCEEAANYWSEHFGASTTDVTLEEFYNRMLIQEDDFFPLGTNLEDYAATDFFLDFATRNNKSRVSVESFANWLRAFLNTTEGFYQGFARLAREFDLLYLQ
jgi:hypothetical protein